MSAGKDTPANDTDILARTCPVCHKVYAGRSQLYRHLREIHNSYDTYYHKMDERATHTFKCLEGCDLSFRVNRDLREHLNMFHEFNIRESSKEFRCIEDFNKWFANLEETGAHFVKHQGSYVNRYKNGEVVTYYICNRSGLQRKRAIIRKRKEKKHGSRKINAGCTSFLKLTEFQNKCMVTYCNFHYGHKIELEHLPLPFKARAGLIDQLEKGAQIVRIKLENEGNYIKLNNLQRSQILTSADLKSLKYFTRKEMKITPPEVLKNIRVLKQETPSTLTENDDQLEVITIISNDSEPENKGFEQTVIFCDTDHEAQEFLSENHESEQLDEDMEDLDAKEETEESTGDDDQGDTIEYFEETKEDVFGRHVAESLHKMEPPQRKSVMKQIDKILDWFLSKSENSAD